MEALNHRYHDPDQNAMYRLGVDGLEIGHWDKDLDRWVELDDEYRQSLDRAFRIARKQLPPDLTRLPVPAPEDRT